MEKPRRDVIFTPTLVLAHFQHILEKTIKKTRLGLGRRVPFGWKHPRPLFLEDEKLS